MALHASISSVEIPIDGTSALSFAALNTPIQIDFYTDANEATPDDFILTAPSAEFEASADGATWGASANLGVVSVAPVPGYVRQVTQLVFGTDPLVLLNCNPQGTLVFVDTTDPVLSGVLDATPGNGQVDLDWPDASDNVGVDHYVVEYGTTLAYGSTWLPNPSSSAVTVTGLVNDTPYFFRVTAYDAAGNASDSLTATATPVSGGSEADWTFPTDGNTVGNWAMSAGSGATVADLANSFDGTISGGASWEASSPVGHCLVLDGINGQISFGTDNAFDPSGAAFSIELLVKITAGFADYAGLVGRYDNSDGNIGWEIHLQAGAHKGSPSLVAVGYSYPTTPAVLGTAAWRYLSVTKAAGAAPKFYLDGVLKSPTSGSSQTLLDAFDGGELLVGAGIVGCNPAAMRIAAMRYSNVARSQAEITAVWNSLSGLI